MEELFRDCPGLTAKAMLFTVIALHWKGGVVGSGCDGQRRKGLSHGVGRRLADERMGVFPGGQNE